MNTSTHGVGVIPFAQRRSWLDLADFATQLDLRPAKEAVRFLEHGGPRLDRAAILRAWTWLGHLMDSQWGLSGQIHAAGHSDEKALLNILASVAAECHNIATGANIDPAAWERLRHAAEHTALNTVGSRRWTLFHALSAAHAVADSADSPRQPSGRTAVVEAFTAMVELTDSEHHRQTVLRQAVGEWLGPGSNVVGGQR